VSRECVNGRYRTNCYGTVSRAVDLVVGVGLVLTGIVALLLEEAVVVEIVVVTEIVVWRLFKLQR